MGSGAAIFSSTVARILTLLESFESKVVKRALSIEEPEGGRPAQTSCAISS